MCAFVHDFLLLVAAVPQCYSFNMLVGANLSYDVVMLPLTFQLHYNSGYYYFKLCFYIMVCTEEKNNTLCYIKQSTFTKLKHLSYPLWLSLCL